MGNVRIRIMLDVNFVRNVLEIVRKEEVVQV